MWYIYKYIYYCLYSVLLFINKRNDIIEWSTTGILSILISFNILTVYFIIKPYFFSNIDERKSNLFYIIGFLSISFNIYLFIRNGKYKCIIEEFSVKTLSSSGILLVLLYVILTVWISWIVIMPA
jgi:hypothetical protein